VNPQILLYELTRAIGESRLPDAAKRLQNLTVFAKDLYKVVQELDKSTAGSSLEAASRPNTLAVGGNTPGRADDKEQKKKKAVLTCYHQHKHAPFFRRRSDGGSSPVEPTPSSQ